MGREPGFPTSALGDAGPVGTVIWVHPHMRVRTQIPDSVLPQRLHRDWAAEPGQTPATCQLGCSSRMWHLCIRRSLLALSALVPCSGALGSRQLTACPRRPGCSCSWKRQHPVWWALLACAATSPERQARGTCQVDPG